MNKWLVLAALLALGKVLQSAQQTGKRSEPPCQPAQEPEQVNSAAPAKQDDPVKPRPRRRCKIIDGVLHEQNPLGFGWREVGSDPDEPYWVRRLN